MTAPDVLADVRRLRRTNPYLPFAVAVAEIRWHARTLPEPWTKAPYGLDGFDSATCTVDGFAVRFAVEVEGDYYAMWQDEPWEPFGYAEALDVARSRGMARGPAHE